MLVDVFPIRTRTDTLARAMIEVALHDSPEPGRIFGQAEIERLAASASPGFLGKRYDELIRSRSDHPRSTDTR
jgi:hypothetical protein